MKIFVINKDNLLLLIATQNDSTDNQIKVGVKIKGSYVSHYLCALKGLQSKSPFGSKYVRHLTNTLNAIFLG